MTINDYYFISLYNIWHTYGLSWLLGQADPSMNKRPSNHTRGSNSKRQKLKGEEEEEEETPLNPGRDQQIESTDMKTQD